MQADKAARKPGSVTTHGYREYTAHWSTIGPREWKTTTERRQHGLREQKTTPGRRRAEIEMLVAGESFRIIRALILCDGV